MRALVWAVVLVGACGRGEPEPGHRRGPPIAVPAPDAAPSAREMVGVAACDAYLDSFARCIRKMDRAAQPAARRAMDSLRRSWVASSASPGGGAALAHACQLAGEAARAATSGIGCTF